IDRTLIAPALLDLDLEALAREHGTPLFVYDEDDLRRRCREYTTHFGDDNVAYASKAFLCTAMARLVHEEGLHLDVATGGELHVGLRSGFPAARMILHGNNKSEDELTAALDAGVGRVVVDSFDELDRLEALARDRAVTPRVLVRVTPGVEAHTHVFIETGTEESKFGFTVTEGVALAAASRVATSPVLDLAGLHAHIGSQIYVLESYRRAVEIVVGLAVEIEATTGHAVEELNLGGGLGVRYLLDDPERDVAEYAKALRGALDDACTAARVTAKPRLMVEPGRSIVAQSALTLFRVGTVKEIPGGPTYVAVDGGMSDNPRPVLYGAGYEAYLPDRIDEPRPLVASIAGKHCEQGDLVVADAHLPAGVAVGDLLAVPVTGAYGYSMASNYNKVPRPAVVFVRDGQARVVIRRETLDDLLRLDEP
ncbi:MAG TPA: diaminopimelate decarboxylase, partial [Acidimicrobiia bacterium]|nr:diaminopimelate decarboxylase [Acidimicrobiia bacterium]